MLDVPMYFVYRNGTYLDASGQSFRDFLDGRLPALPGEKPTLKDWEDHLTTAFPEVRLKRFLEMRGADGGPWRRICALPALWAGLLYHQETLDAAWDLASGWSMEERLRLREEVPRLGLKAEIRGRSVLDIATDVVDLANRGLTARARLNGAGDNETGFLSPLSQVVENRETPAERKLALYHGPWNESVDPIFFECSY
jgi:glutamate--cysteine ligase